MKIKYATKHDIKGLNRLLKQTLMVHHQGRPDIFKSNSSKYTDEQLKIIIADKNRPVFIAADDSENVIGYAFCVLQEHKNDNILTNIRTLYIDDLCVDENARGQHIGKQLYDFVISYAKQIECYNVTLNVWTCNTNAIKFYEKCGLKPQKIGMEIIL